VNIYTSNAVVVSLSSTCLVWCSSFLYINPNRVKKEGISMDVNCEFVFTCLMPASISCVGWMGRFLTDCAWLGARVRAYSLNVEQVLNI
jgi:hypothetical protein